MGLDISLRLKNIHTGELKELQDFRGRDFAFVKKFVESQDLYGQYITLSPEEIEALIQDGLMKLRADGFEQYEFDDSCGVMGFVKILHLAGYYARFGYSLQVEADW